jgi:hypothetical protein
MCGPDVVLRRRTNGMAWSTVFLIAEGVSSVFVNAKTVLAALMLLLLLAPSAVHAGDVDTQFVFGFTQGADVGELGEKEIESETVGRFGKADGSYAVLTSQLRAELVPFENFHFEVGAIVNYSSISGVS